MHAILYTLESVSLAVLCHLHYTLFILVNWGGMSLFCVTRDFFLIRHIYVPHSTLGLLPELQEYWSQFLKIMCAEHGPPPPLHRMGHL